MWIRNNITALVIIQFLATVTLAFVPVIYWGDYFYVISNLFGYSIISNYMILTHIWKRPFQYCEIVRAMVLSLMFSNVISILAKFMSYEYYSLVFDRYFLSAFFALLYIYFKKKHGNYCL